MTCTKAALWVPNTNSLTHANLTRRQTSDITSDVRHQTSVYAASHAQTQPPGAGPAPVQHGCAGSGPAARARGGARRAGARDGGGPVLPQPHAPGLAPPRRQSALPRERHTAARSVVARLESCGGAELTAAVIPPAIHGVVDRHTAGEVEPRADRAERQSARDGDGRRRGARRATAQLARAIVAPAVRSAVRCHAATVARAGPELGERRRTLNEEGLRAHQRPGAAEFSRQAAGVGGKPGSELAEFEERHRDRGGSSLPLARRREHAGARCVPSRDARGRDGDGPRV